MKFIRLICCFLCLLFLYCLVACGDKKPSKVESQIVSYETVSVEYEREPEIIPDELELVTEIRNSAPLYRFGDRIYQLKIPYSDVYMSVFFVRDINDWFIIDTGSSGLVASNYIIPAANAIELPIENVKAIVVTRKDNDHVGGLGVLAAAYPNAKIYGIWQHFPSGISNTFVVGTYVGSCLEMINVGGYGDNAFVCYDNRSKTLLTGDVLQFFGVSKLGCRVENIEEYYTSLKELCELEIDNVIASMPFCPNGAYAIGRDASKKYLNDCIATMDSIKLFVENTYKSGVTDPKEIESKLISHYKASYPDFPTEGFELVIKSIIEKQ